ncbi:DUF305 domain-containing protein [Microbacterium sp. BWT-B31]|uniref:DUF305 domain-containing protein n=1 Tax=Microbacterium sp. BWT-B31 TaxID=3232072 RepID=UPI0035299C83
MRRTMAAGGVVAAVATALAAAAAVMLGLTVPPPAAPAAASAAADVATAGLAAAPSQYPTVQDYCYVEGMIPHHAQALELSGLLLDASGASQRTRALAAFIVTDQSAEIEIMRHWQDAWRTAAPAQDAQGSADGHTAHSGPAAEATPTGCGDHGHGAMAGMASPDQLAALDAADGAAAERMFLELMIAHHQGALEMATLAVTTGSNAFVRTSGKHVLVEQDREITAMRRLLGELP